MIIGVDEETVIWNYRKWNKRRGRNYQTLNEGDKVIYCYCPLNPRKTGSGSNVDACPQILVEYDGVIIQKTPHHITLEIVPRDGQIIGYDKPKPYKISISRSDVGVTDIIRKIAQNE